MRLKLNGGYTMKKYFAVLVLLLFGCAVSSNVQQYRFANDPAVHNFQVIQNGAGNNWTLEIDGAAVLSGGFGLLSYENTIVGNWTGKKVSMELKYYPGVVGIGKKTTAAVFVEGEKITEFIF